jgi:hypothetical protein
MQYSKLPNERVEPKIVNSNFFDSDDDKSKISENDETEKSTENFSQIMQKLRSKHNLKFQSQQGSLQFSQKTEVESKPGNEGISQKKFKNQSQQKKEVSNLLNNLFTEMSAGEKIVDDTYFKVNQRNDVGFIAFI